MILPDKSIQPARALIAVGARVLETLDRPQTVSHVWQRLTTRPVDDTRLDYGWFILALDLLFALGAVDLRDGLLVRASAGSAA